MNFPEQRIASIVEGDNDEIDLQELIFTLSEGKWIIVIITFISMFLAGIYAFGKTPIYQADALLQVESENAGVPGIEELAGLTGDNASAGTELEIIKSRKIIGQAVDQLKLDIVAKPLKIGLFGNLSKRFAEPEDVGVVPLGLSWLSNYSWSNEKIVVNRFDVPQKYFNKEFSLVANENKTFTLFLDEKEILYGSVNEFLSSKDGRIKINIQELKATKGNEFKIKKISKLEATKILQREIKVSERGKKTGIITLVLEGQDKDQIKDILNKVSNAYLQQNKSRSSEEASNALNFLNEQIKPIKEEVDIAEAALKEFRTNNQTADMSMETQNVLKVVADIDTELQRLSLRRDQLKLKYTENHPTIESLNSQESRLQKKRKETLSEIKELPETQQQLLKLEGEYQVANNIYIDLLNNIQEFKIAKASNVGNAYILDTPEAQERPVKPKKLLVLALGSLIGIMLGVIIVFLKKALNNKVNTPEKLEENFGLPVYATIPFSKAVKTSGGLRKDKRQKTLLALDDKNDSAIESLRSLRTSLHFALLEAKNNIVMMTGPSPGIGKSFISSNLAAVAASTGQRVLLIDADMRKGYLHDLLDIKTTPGLSDLISGKSNLEESLNLIEFEEKTFDVITRGSTPPNPSELLMHSNFEKLLDELTNVYDLILIDTPPVHAVTDPTIIGSIAGVVFMVVKQEMHTMKEIEHALKRLSQTGVETKGFLFNGYRAKKSAYGYDYSYQSYYGDYKSD